MVTDASRGPVLGTPTAVDASINATALAESTPVSESAADTESAPVAERASVSGPVGRSGLRRVWWLSLVALFLLPAAWAVSTPYDGAYDEHHHVVRAAGVVRGQILVPPLHQYYDGGYQRVPASLVPPGYGCMGDIARPATCLGTPSSDRTLVPVQSGAARYNPVYYAVVGWPLAVLPNMTGVILARLFSALLCAAMLASALVTVWPLRRYRLLMLAVLCTVTPILMTLNGLVNPSGLEIDAAVLLWVALLRLLSREARPADEAETRRLVGCAVLAGAVLALGRPVGLGIVAAVVVFAGFALAGRRTLRSLLSRRDVRWGGLIVALASALAVGWVLISRMAEFGADAKTVTAPTGQVVRTIVLFHFDTWIQGTVGLFGYGAVGLPMWVIVLWGAMQGLLVLTGFGAAGSRRHALTIAAIPVVCFALGLLVDMIMARIVGYFMQGRYFLPLWVGMFFLAALATPARYLPATMLRRIYLVAYAIWSLSILLSLYLILHHYRYGVPGRHHDATTWTPIFGYIPPYATVLIGIALVGWLVRQHLRDHTATSPTATGQVLA